MPLEKDRNCHSSVLESPYGYIDLVKSSKINFHSYLHIKTSFNYISRPLSMPPLLNNRTNKHYEDDKIHKHYEPDKLNIIMGDCHIYESHIEAVRQQLERIPYDLPKLHIKQSHHKLEKYEFSDIEILNYQSHPAIKAEMIA
jgi:hypothetical protein